MSSLFLVGFNNQINERHICSCMRRLSRKYLWQGPISGLCLCSDVKLRLTHWKDIEQSFCAIGDFLTSPSKGATPVDPI
jgi:hypothetical protein